MASICTLLFDIAHTHLLGIIFKEISRFLKLGPEPAFVQLGLVGSSGGYTYHRYTSHTSPRACGTRLGRKVSRNGRNVISPIYTHFWKVSWNGRNAISPIYRHFWKVSRNGRNAISPIYRHFWGKRQNNDFCDPQTDRQTDSSYYI